jgi:hypothetical protein
MLSRVLGLFPVIDGDAARSVDLGVFEAISGEMGW